MNISNISRRNLHFDKFHLSSCFLLYYNCLEYGTFKKRHHLTFCDNHQCSNQILIDRSNLFYVYKQNWSRPHWHRSKRRCIRNIFNRYMYCKLFSILYFHRKELVWMIGKSFFSLRAIII